MQVSGWVFLLQQGLSAAALLLALGRQAHLGRIFPLRLLLTACLTALACLMSVLYPLSRWLMLPLACLSPMATWPGVPRRMRLRLALVCGAMALMLSGTVRLMASMGWPPMLLTPMSCLMLLLTPRLAPALSAPRCVSVSIRHAAHRLTLTALVDSGNLLRDPLTSLPVIVISRRAAGRLISLPGPGAIGEGMRLMRIRTVSGTALMTIFRPGSVHLSGGGPWKSCRAMIGLSPENYEGFQALVPASLLEEQLLSSLSSCKEEVSP